MSGPSFVLSTQGEPPVPTYMALAALPVRLDHTDNQHAAVVEAHEVGWSLQPFFNRVGLLGDEEGMPWVTSYGEEGETCILYAKHALGLVGAASLEEKQCIELRSFKNRSLGLVSDPAQWSLANSEPTERFVRRINAGLAEVFHACHVVTNVRDELLRAVVLVVSAPVLLQIRMQALRGEQFFRGRRWDVLEDLSASGRLTVLRWQPES